MDKLRVESWGEGKFKGLNLWRNVGVNFWWGKFKR